MATKTPQIEAPPPLPGGSPDAAPGERAFVHLHLHSEYSLLDGGNRIDKLLARVKELGMSAVGVTDHGNLFGAVAFYQAAKDKGIKPILGVEAYVTPPDRDRRDRTYTGSGDGGYHLVLLAENNTGWNNLLYLCSEAFLTGFYYKPRIDRELLAAHAEGLIAINGHLGSEIGDHLLDYERTKDEKFWERAVESARWHADAFASSPPRFYIELQHHVPEQNAINRHLIRLARELGLPLVCDNDAHFLRAEDHDAHDTLICISTAKSKSDTARMRYPPELYVKSPREMHELFEPYAEAGREALGNTVAIAERCRVELPLGASHAPMVRIDLPEPASLPRHDDPAYAGDLTAWYKDYCSRFELRPFRDGEAGVDAAAVKSECDAALRMLAEAGLVWRYGPGVRGGEEIRRGRGVETQRAQSKSEPDAGAGPGSADERERSALRSSASSSATSAYSPPHFDAHTEKLARLERELTILADKGISAYFLIVWDFVNWGRQQGIPALARGSGVGTMVGYALGLSNACPVRYGLLFERFTDPDRAEYPDIDIDLCQDGRARVIDYVRRKYGHVAQIITFGTLKARAAIRDVARVLEIPLPEADKIAKLIPEQLGITLDMALAQEPDLRKLYESDDRIRRLIDNARTLEGQARHASVHAAGVIVATRPLHEIVPLYKQAGSGEDEVVTQWDGPTCEKMGLLKMDFLGLRTLSTIERAKGLIREGLGEEEIWEAVGRGEEFRATQRGRGAARQRGRDGGQRGSEAANEGGTDVSAGEAFSASLPCSSPASLPGCLAAPLSAHPLDLDRLTFDDPKVFELFQRGDVTGVFQFESGGMRRLLTEMRPDRLEDLIAANALFRPGPMDLIPDYNRRKHGTEPVPAIHPVVDRHTAETYGVMVYQEQVMQIVHGLGGIGLRDAYSLIKNISKKRHDKIEKERPKFIGGAQKQGLTRPGAEELFELILKFAGYGFNKSHSTGYAIVAYQTAYLKTYFPNQYMAAFLTYESAANKVSEWVPYLEDCKKTRFVGSNAEPGKVGVEVRPPDVNLSQSAFSVIFEEGEPRDARHGHVRFGLNAIKGVGEKAIEAIIREREGEAARQGDSETVRPRSRSYTSLFDFCERVMARGPGTITKATIEALIKCGAFDSVHGREHRAAMLATVESAMSAASKSARDKAAGQGALFGLGGNVGGAGTPATTLAAALPLAKVEPWAESQLLDVEKEVLGFYISSHPLDAYAGWIQAFTPKQTPDLKACQARERILLAGLVQSARTLVVRTGASAGQKMAILTFDDRAGTVEAVAFSDVYAKFEHLLREGSKCFLIGEVDHTRGEPQVIIERALPIECLPRQPLRWLDLLFDGVLFNGSCARVMQETRRLLDETIERQARHAPVTPAGGEAKIPLRVFVQLPEAERPVPIPIGEGWSVTPTPELMQALLGLLAEGRFRLSGNLLAKAAEERPRWNGNRGEKGRAVG